MAELFNERWYDRIGQDLDVVISSRVRIRWRGRNCMSSAMQYTHRKSQRSVTDIRR